MVWYIAYIFSSSEGTALAVLVSDVEKFGNDFTYTVWAFVANHISSGEWGKHFKDNSQMKYMPVYRMITFLVI